MTLTIVLISMTLVKSQLKKKKSSIFFRFSTTVENPGEYPNIWVNIYACSQCRHATISDRLSASRTTICSNTEMHDINQHLQCFSVHHYRATCFRWDTQTIGAAVIAMISSMFSRNQTDLLWMLREQKQLTPPSSSSVRKVMLCAHGVSDSDRFS